MCVATALLSAACSSGDDGGDDGAGDGDVTRVTSVEDGLEAIRVPQDQSSIQAAVDSAQDGDLILVGKGVYNEAVDVARDDLEDLTICEVEAV